MPNSKESQQGLIHPLLLLLAVVGVAGALIVINASNSHTQSSSVKGIQYLADKGDSVSNSGSSDSSGSSNSSGSGDNNTSSGNSNSSGVTNVTQSPTTISNSSSSEDSIKQNESSSEKETESNKGKDDTETKTKDTTKLESEQESSSSSDLSENTSEFVKVHVKHNGSFIQISIKNASDSGEIEEQGVKALSNFPLTVASESGQLEVITPNGVKEIRVLPAQASDIAKQAGVQNQIETIELIQNTIPDSSDTTVFKITGMKSGTLLGIIPVNVDVESLVGAQTGTILQTNEPFWLQFLSPLITQ